MGANSHIEWTEATWNPVTGCTKISAGCKNCYAERLALRLRAMGAQRYRNGFDVTLHEDVLDLPRTWKKPRRIFVNSMSDLFHPEVPLSFIRRVFKTMEECPQHTFQVLTKRSDRVRKLSMKLSWPRNVWMGVSVEDSRVFPRIDDLREVPAAVRFLSCEPLIGSLAGIDLRSIHWVIVGGESGPHSRSMQIEWVREIFRACRKEKVPFFFKQWGGVQKHRTGRDLGGRTYDEMPQAMAVAA
ncbi:MAG: phage Gp37/Gp68 family protein [Acidobacteriota bacterium]|nr:phage Gp37/Gp68 family protein [Acidobacteriota bacterium]